MPEPKPECPIPVKLLPIAGLLLDVAAQCRDQEDEETIARYAEDWQEGGEFPPVVAFDDGTVIRLADGKKRVLSAQRGGMEKIRAYVFIGGLRDATLYAASANISHGLASSRADKRRAVESVLRVAPDLADREIARRCGVHHSTVSGVRQGLTGEISQSSIRTGADGRTIDTSKIGTKPAERLGPDEAAELRRAEGVIQSGKDKFAAVGAALREVRDSGLYRAEHATFEDFCDAQPGGRPGQMKATLDLYEELAKVGG